MTDEAINLVRHIVGNNVCHPRIYHDGKSHRTVDDIRGIQREVTGRLEEQLEVRGITNTGAREVLQALKDYDWGEATSYRSFIQIYDGFTWKYDDEVRALRDELLKQRR